MTARHEIRVGNRRLGRGQAVPIDATPAPSVGEILALARERRGVDLFRAERDTKIRARYLAALEQDDETELPGAVYAKGFLRNYAVYLDLDPEALAERWNEQTASAHAAEQIAVAPPPQPLTAPSGGLTLTLGLAIRGVLVLGILAFVAYLVLQVVRFSEVPMLQITQPATAVSQSLTQQTTLVGMAPPAAAIEISAPGDQILRATADEAGHWSREVPLVKGTNEFTVVATDPTTGKPSDPMRLIITVPLPGDSAAPSSQPTTAVTPVQLTVTAPVAGSLEPRNRVTVTGTTNATTVRITATRIGDRPSAGSPTTDPGGPTPAPIVETVTVDDGAFSHQLTLNPGEWRIQVEGSALARRPVTETRLISVSTKDELVLSIEARRSAWIQVHVDGSLAPGYAQGKTLRRGATETFSADRSIRVRTGNSGNTIFIVNGKRLGTLGRLGAVETWVFRPGRDPERVANR